MCVCGVGGRCRRQDEDSDGARKSTRSGHGPLDCPGSDLEKTTHVTLNGRIMLRASVFSSGGNIICLVELLGGFSELCVMDLGHCLAQSYVFKNQ